jgi:hypothetical protein
VDSGRSGSAPAIRRKIGPPPYGRTSSAWAQCGSLASIRWRRDVRMAAYRNADSERIVRAVRAAGMRWVDRVFLIAHAYWYRAAAIHRLRVGRDRSFTCGIQSKRRDR